MLQAVLFSSVDPNQGLIIAKRHYAAIGGHRGTPDPETETACAPSGAGWSCCVAGQRSLRTDT